MANDDYKLDNFDQFDSFDEDFNFEEPKDDRHPVTKVATGALRGAKDAILSKNFLVRLVRGALPETYQKPIDLIDRGVDDVRQLYDKAAREIKPELRQLARATRTLSPSIKSVIGENKSNSLQRTLDRLGGESDAGTPVISDQERNNLQIQKELLETFQDAQEENAEQTKNDRVQDALRDRVKTDLQRKQLRAMGGVGNSLGILATGASTTLKYQRKSLELKYRMYFLMDESLKESKRNNAAAMAELAAIRKNTGLPDYLKLQGSELFTEMMKRRLYGNIQEGVGDYLNNFGMNLRENITRKLKDVTDGIRSGLSGVTTGLEMANMASEAGMDGWDMAGDMTGSVTAEWARGLAAKHLRPLIKKIPGVEKYGDKAAYIADTLPERANEFAKGYSMRGGVLGSLINAAREVIPMYRPNVMLDKNTAESGYEGAGFDVQTHRTVNITIPEYLSRILFAIKGGGNDDDREVYSHTRNTFTTRGRLKKDISREILPENELNYGRHVAESLLKQMGADQLSPGAQDALRDKLYKDSSELKRFDPERWVREFEITGPHRKELEDFVRGHFQIGWDDKMADTDESARRLRVANQFYREIGRASPAIGKRVRAAAAQGNIDILKELGMLTSDNDDSLVPLFNRQYVLNRLNGKPTDGAATANVRGMSGVVGASQLGGQDTSGMAETQARMLQLIQDIEAKRAEEQYSNASGKSNDLSGILGNIADILKGTSVKDEMAALLEKTDTGIHVFGEFTTGEDGDIVIAGGAGGADRGKNWATRNFGRAGRMAWGATKWLGRTWKNSYQAYLGALKGVGTAAYGAASGAVGKLADIVGARLTDIYVNGELLPRLTKAKMKAGEYFSKDGKVIKSIRDIFEYGAVYDSDGNVLLSLDDIKRGIYDNRLKRIVGKVKDATLGLWNMQFKFGLGMARQLINFAKAPLASLRDKILQINDVFVVGEDRPRLTAWGIRKGDVYIDGNTKKFITSMRDITGPVLDKDGNEIISQEDYDKGLVTRKGLLTRMAMRGVGMVKNAVKTTAKMVGSIFGGIRRGIGGFISAATGYVPTAQGGIGGGDKTQYILNAIYNLLDNRLEGDPSGPLDLGRFDKTSIKGSTTALFRLMRRKFRRHDKSAIDDGDVGDQNKKRWWQTQLDRMKSGRKSKSTDAGPDGKPETTNGLLGGLLGAVLGVGTAIKTGITWLGEKILAVKAASTAGDVAGDILGGAAGGAGGKGKGGWIRKAGRGLWGAGKWLGKAALTAAIFLPEAAVAVGSGILTVGGAILSGIASVLSAPVVIAGLAIAGIAYGGYKAYQHYKTLGDFQKLRLAQYGVDLGNRSQCLDMLSFESLVQKDVGKGRNGQAVIEKPSTMDYLDHFGVDENDSDGIERFTIWMHNRFLPVFLTHATLMNIYGSSEDVEDEDDDVEDKNKPTVARKSKHRTSDSPYPYMVDASPFENTTSTTDTSVIDELIAAIVTKYAQEEKDAGIDSTTVIPETVTSSGDKSAQNRDTVGIATLRNSNPMSPEELKRKAEQRDKVEGRRNGQLITLTGSGKPMLGVMNALDDFATIRMYTYGLTVLHRYRLDAILTMERKLAERVKFANNIATLDIHPSQLFNEFGYLFNATSTDFQTKEAWIVWVQIRFLPVFLDFMTAIKTITSNPDVWAGLASLGKPELYLLAKRIIETTASIHRGDETPVWQVTASPFPGDKSGTDKSVCSPFLDNLKGAQTQVVRTPQSQTKPSQAPKQTPATAEKQEESKSWFQRVKESLFDTKKDKQASNAFAQRNRSNQQENRQRRKGAGPTGGKTIPPVRMGTGGKLDQIPMPTGDGWQGTKDTIVAAAKMAGVDPGIMSTMASIESSYRPYVGASTSSAVGLYQFTSGTWADMLRKYGRTYGIPMDTPPTDPRANALMAAEYIKENMTSLKSSLNRPITDADVYLAHFLGAGGAKELLSSDSSTPAAEINPSAARSNYNIFYNGGRSRTTGEVYQVIKDKVDSHSDNVADARQSANSVIDDKVASAPSLTAPSTGVQPERNRNALGAPGIGLSSMRVVAEPGSNESAQNASGEATAASADTSSSAARAIVADKATKAAAEAQQDQQVKAVVDMGSTNKILEKQLDVLAEIATNTKGSNKLMTDIYDTLNKMGTSKSSGSSSAQTTLPNASRQSTSTMVPLVSTSRGNR